MKAIRNNDIDRAIDAIRQVMAGGKDGDRLAAAKLLLERAIGPTLRITPAKARLMKLLGPWR